MASIRKEYGRLHRAYHGVQETSPHYFAWTQSAEAPVTAVKREILPSSDEAVLSEYQEKFHAYLNATHPQPVRMSSESCPEVFCPEVINPKDWNSELHSEFISKTAELELQRTVVPVAGVASSKAIVPPVFFAWKRLDKQPTEHVDHKEAATVKESPIVPDPIVQTATLPSERHAGVAHQMQPMEFIELWKQLRTKANESAPAGMHSKSGASGWQLSYAAQEEPLHTEYESKFAVARQPPSVGVDLFLMAACVFFICPLFSAACETMCSSN